MSAKLPYPGHAAAWRIPRPVLLLGRHEDGGHPWCAPSCRVPKRWN